MGELRGNFWEVKVTKWKKLTTFYGGKWGEIDCGFRNADCGIRNKSVIQNRKPGSPGQYMIPPCGGHS